MTIDYRDQLRDELDALLRAHDLGDRSALASHAHRLCSHALLVHHAAIGDLSRRIELLARDPASSGIEALVDTLRGETQELLRLLELEIGPEERS